MKFLSEEDLFNLVIRLAKLKKDNKELLSYLLFEADNEHQYVEGVKKHLDEEFASLNPGVYYAKKGLRKILRNLKKQIKYSGKKETEVELLIYFCKKMKTSSIRFSSSTVLQNLYDNQIKSIEKAIGKLHEDLQFDFKMMMEEL
ncbi:hypothetical protein [Litoribacter ruber]|uniref:hypothetical protein n=1 Tax=Litoribacter ruber TaxID=702568 RepID=UPI001FEAA8EC|nr:MULTISPECIES: hypothetical protein [Litoribacter]